MHTDIQQKDLPVDHTTHSIRQILKFAFNNRFPSALWRLPEQHTIHMVVDVSGFKELDEIDLEELPQGFIFCPYQDGAKVFIQGDIHFISEETSLSFGANVPSELRQTVEDLVAQDTEDAEGGSSNSYFNKEDLYIEETGKQEYLKMVQASISAIKDGSFEKVVPSRTKELPLINGFNVVDNFIRLTENYPHTFISFVSIPGMGSWMGATPEVLIEIENRSVFRTVSLAGTQKYTDNTHLEDVAWTQKEIEEQAMVSRYIINCFKKIRLREFIEHGPKTVVAGNLMHLKTTYQVDLSETGFFNLGTIMLKLLHPTSAVCGLPKAAAQDFLDDNEKHQRGYYCGFLGSVDNGNDTHIFVNLRCMELYKDKAVLYAGSGVTEDSIPEKEWLETEMKCNTLLDVIEI